MRFEFKTIDGIGEGIYVEKGSKFISRSYSVQSIEEVKKIIQDLQSEHLKSRHICYAFRIGIDPEIQKMEDDGEPSGTAGKPILGQLIKFDLYNSMVVVIRYFGGILLGASGLGKAYKIASTDCLNHSKQVIVPITQLYLIETDQYNIYKILQIAKSLEISYRNVVIDLQSSIELFLPLKLEHQFFSELKRKIDLNEEINDLKNIEISNCQIQLLKKNTCFTLD